MIEQIAKTIGGSQIGAEGDGVDRLHFKLAPSVFFLLMGFSILIKYTGLMPIVCWMPAVFRKPWIEYSTWYCWVQNTYQLDNGNIFVEDISGARDVSEVTEIKYYQWVPVIFCSVAVFFYMPRLLWQSIVENSGIPLSAMVNSVNGFESAINLEKRKTCIKHMAKFLDTHLECKPSERSIASKIMCCFSRSSMNYLGNWYTLVKCLELANGFFLMYWLSIFLGPNFQWYGFQVLHSFITGEGYEDTNRFPLLSLCDVERKAFAQLEKWTMQCVLTLNLYNEKLFLAGWLFIVYITLVTLLNTISWFTRIYLTKSRCEYIEGLLVRSQAANYNRDADKPYLAAFVNKFLRPDGVFAIRMLNANTTTVIMHEILGQLWLIYRHKPESAQIRGGIRKMTPQERLEFRQAELENKGEPGAPPLPTESIA